MKILHISDTHGYHGLLPIPDGLDIIIHSGDASNHRSPYMNREEMLNFLEWYGTLLVPYRIFIAGNHDTSIEAGLITKKDFEDRGIIYLENESVEINDIKIWGSPCTPSFGQGWAFNKDRAKIHKIWDTIPEDTDIVVTHGPCKGVLDLSYSPANVLEFCGCANLKKRILNIQPFIFMSGHIHNTEDIINAGTTRLSAYKTTFSNGSVVTDGKFGSLSSIGNLFNI